MIAKIIMLAVAIGCFAASLAGLKHFDDEDGPAEMALCFSAAFFSMLGTIAVFCMIASELFS